MDAAADQREDQKDLLKVARRILEVQKLRHSFFPSAIFGEPAWNILLALYLSSNRADRTVGRLGESSGTPLSTTIRWLNYLESEGLVMLDSGSDDPQQREVHLTDKACDSLCAFLSKSNFSGEQNC